MGNPSEPSASHPPRILGVFAHPDDEVFCAGGTLAKYVTGGALAMVVSVTRGEAGQIRDASVATRRTLGQVRKRELQLACAELGVQECRCLDYADGSLASLEPDVLTDEVRRLIEEFRPDVVITFGADGAYGHPDHVAVSEATTEACAAAGGVRLFHSHFPRSRMMMLDRLAEWLVELSERFKGSVDFVHALSIFAQETTTLGYASDYVDVSWFPAGSYIIEQGERATSLYLIISGQVEVIEEIAEGQRRVLARRGPGEFVGELGIAFGKPRMANVIAVDSVTCLVFSFAEPSAYDGRGPEAVLGAQPWLPAADRYSRAATARIDVRGQIDRKVAAIAAHRSQYPVAPEMFPATMLTEMFGEEHFVRVLPPPVPETGLLPGG